MASAPPATPPMTMSSFRIPSKMPQEPTASMAANGNDAPTGVIEETACCAKGCERGLCLGIKDIFECLKLVFMCCFGVCCGWCRPTKRASRTVMENGWDEEEVDLQALEQGALPPLENR